MQLFSFPRKLWICALLIAALSSPVIAAMPTDFDVRLDQSESAQQYRQRHLAAAKALRPGKHKAVKSAIQAPAMSTLAVQRAPADGRLRVLNAVDPRARLSAPSSGDRVATLRGFLRQHAALYGVTAEQIEQLEVVADYRNPDGGLAWVRLRQLLRGLPVHDAEITGAFDAEDRLFRVIGAPAFEVDDAMVDGMPANAAPAILSAAAAVEFSLPSTPMRASSSSDDTRQAQRFTVAGSPDEITAEGVIFVVEPGVARPAWRVHLSAADAAWYVIVDAEDHTVLWWQNLLHYQTQPITVTAYADDSPAPTTPGPFAPDGSQPLDAISRSTITPPLAPFNLLGWIPDGESITTGNNVDTGIDRDGVNGIDPNGRATGTPSRYFGYAYNPSPGNEAQGGNPGDDPLPPAGGPLTAFQLGMVVNAFYWGNWFHDRTYELGFVEAAGNFQNDNFGRGGVAGDATRMEMQDSSGANNANFNAGADGSFGRLQVFVFTGPNPDRDAGLDQELILHELTHGLSRRVVGNGAGLGSPQSSGLGEGWSDCFARFLLAQAEEPADGTYPFASYVMRQFGTLGEMHSYYGIRSFPYALRNSIGGPQGLPHNPVTFADIDPTQFDISDGAFAPNPAIAWTATAANFRGQVWCSALFEAHANLVTDMGFGAGNNLMLQLLVDGMKLTPPNPNFIDARDAILAAATVSAPGSVRALWQGFAARGLGVDATTDGNTSVVESFAVPSFNEIFADGFE